MNIHELSIAILEGLEPKYEYFWKTTDHFGCGSQWLTGYPFQDNITPMFYKSTEQYMMVQKALTFGDLDKAKEILNARTPRDCKQLGRQISDFKQESWDMMKYDIVVAGNMLKFRQHPKLKRQLLATGTKILVEASPYDKIWGIGLTAEEAEGLNPDQWKGENLLGFALMDVRSRLSQP